MRSVGMQVEWTCVYKNISIKKNYCWKQIYYSRHTRCAPEKCIVDIFLNNIQYISARCSRIKNTLKWCTFGYMPCFHCSATSRTNNVGSSTSPAKAPQAELPARQVCSIIELQSCSSNSIIAAATCVCILICICAYCAYICM